MQIPSYRIWLMKERKFIYPNVLTFDYLNNRIWYKIGKGAKKLTFGKFVLHGLVAKHGDTELYEGDVARWADETYSRTKIAAIGQSIWTDARDVTVLGNLLETPELIQETDDFKFWEVAKPL